MRNANGTSRLAILAVLAIALAAVLYFMQNPSADRAVMVLAFLGAITTALLKIAGIERNQHELNGKVDAVRNALDAAVPKVHEAAHTAEDAAARIEQATQTPQPPAEPPAGAA